MANIEVDRVPGGPSEDAFRVTITDRGTSSEHRVTIEAPPPDAANRFPTPEEFVRACFEFLLQREPKESILRSFEIRQIGRYFADWEESLTR